MNAWCRCYLGVESVCLLIKSSSSQVLLKLTKLMNFFFLKAILFTLTAIYLISFIAKTKGHRMKGRFLTK